MHPQPASLPFPNGEQRLLRPNPAPDNAGAARRTSAAARRALEEHEAREEARRIETLLNRLPPEQAEAIRLHTYASLRFTEIAEVLRCPVSTVKSRFAGGIEKLRKMSNL